jgi:nucleolar pre-ribosomal-associated protein 1
MEIYRRAGVFERIFSLYSSPITTEPLKKKVLHLIYRACEVRGSTTLLTRAAVMSWIQGQALTRDPNHKILQSLAGELYRTCDQEWLDRWSRSALRDIPGQLV